MLSFIFVMSSGMFTNTRLIKSWTMILGFSTSLRPIWGGFILILSRRSNLRVRSKNSVVSLAPKEEKKAEEVIDYEKLPIVNQLVSLFHSSLSWDGCSPRVSFPNGSVRYGNLCEFVETTPSNLSKCTVTLDKHISSGCSDFYAFRTTPYSARPRSGESGHQPAFEHKYFPSGHFGLGAVSVFRFEIARILSWLLIICSHLCWVCGSFWPKRKFGGFEANLSGWAIRLSWRSESRQHPRPLLRRNGKLNRAKPLQQRVWTISSSPLSRSVD